MKVDLKVETHLISSLPAFARRHACDKTRGKRFPEYLSIPDSHQAHKSFACEWNQQRW
jgi:hypothetical protein